MRWIKKHTALGLFLLVVIVGFVLSPSIGPSWDEPDNMFSGGVYLNFFQHSMNPTYFQIMTNAASAFGDRIFPQYRTMAELPPVHNFIGVLFVLAAQSLHIPPTANIIIIAWHFATVVFLALTVAMTFRFGLLLGLSEASSLFAAFAVFLYPQIFGHGLSNSKDTAQVAMVITSLYYLVRATKDTKLKIKDLMIGALVWGVGLATKFNAVYVPIIWGIWYFVTRRNIVKTILYGLWIGVVGLVMTVVVWPYLWFDTFAHALEVVRHFTTVGEGYRLIWNGIVYTVGVGKSLWWYPIMSFLYTTPLLLLLLIFVGFVVIVLHLAKKPVWVILPIWVLIPLLRTLSPWAAFYDLLRHFMEIVPALMLVAAVGLEILGGLGKPGKVLVRLIACVVIGQLIFINVLYFPYSTGYYNVLARNANVNFDRDIEALSVKEAMDYVHRMYGNVRIYLPIGGHLSWYYMIPGDGYISVQDGANIVILVNKASHFRMFDYAANYLGDYTMVHQISRGNAIFALIYKKK
jgi:4-amino-4-deoxy-L-arabinose transferase-like glycosyltransferase